MPRARSAALGGRRVMARARRAVQGSALAGVAAGADGVHIEVHHCPEEAKSDGPQALLPEQYAQLVTQIRKVAEIVGRRIPEADGAES